MSLSDSLKQANPYLHFLQLFWRQETYKTHQNFLGDSLYVASHSEDTHD